MQATNDLMEQYAPLVHATAGRVYRSIQCESVEMSDLMQSGYIGLMRAAALYDDSRGVPFGAFARQRVRGEMLDGLRRLQWVPRAMAPRMWDGKNLDQLQHPSEPIPDSRISPECEALNSITHQVVLRAIATLRPRHQLAVQLYYFADLPSDEIAEKMGVTPCRVRQLLARSRARMLRYLRGKRICNSLDLLGAAV